MPVRLNLAPVLPVPGVALSTVAAGIKANGTPDMVLFTLPEGSVSAAVLTRNTFCAAPVTLCRRHLASSQGAVRALLVNSGNANAGTGQPGIHMAEGHCAHVAEILGIRPDQVLPFSTGVIGQLLPDQLLRSGIDAAASTLGTDWQAAARGIMTTDTVPKATSRQCTGHGQTITVSGMAKGAGMIQPDMATMLAYVFTDAAVRGEHLQALLEEVVDVSFNAITVDSDTSTNDACVLSSTGQGPTLTPDDADWPAFRDAVSAVCTELAQALVRDGEGATKFVTVVVSEGRDVLECKRVAYAIANSPLVKTALFASDANVGRLLMAIGKADVDQLDASAVTVWLDDVQAFTDGGIAPGYTEQRGSAVMAREEITLRVTLGQRGPAEAIVYTSDLSHEYVSINADYRS